MAKLKGKHFTREERLRDMKEYANIKLYLQQEKFEKLLDELIEWMCKIDRFTDSEMKGAKIFRKELKKKLTGKGEIE